MKTNLILIVAILFFACTPEKSAKEAPRPSQVELATSYGKIVIELYDKTPLHKANFEKLVSEGAYDSLLFHRVIEGFVIQGGDPESKYANSEDTVGRGGLDYRIPAEFDTTIFHKRGAVGTARNNNPARESNAMQFYIVQAGPVADSIIDKSEERINNWLSVYYTLHAPEHGVWLDSLNIALANDDWQTSRRLNDTIASMAKTFTDFERYQIPPAHREVYRNLGGTPQLDQNYTVFAEVISGMEVVDSIAAVSTNDLDRPLEEVRILSARIIDKY